MTQACHGLASPSDTHDLDATPLAESAPTSVYRYYDTYGLLVYVGITSRGMNRQGEHNKRADWWPFVTSQEVEHYDTRGEALAREKELIQRHLPPFNRQHNPNHLELRRAYVAFAAQVPAAESALDLYRMLGRAVPLMPLEQIDERRVVLRTLAAHQTIAAHLSIRPEDVPRVLLPNFDSVGSVRSVELDGLFARVEIRMAKRHIGSIVTARAHVRIISQSKPVTFRVQRVIVNDRTLSGLDTTYAAGGAA